MFCNICIREKEQKQPLGALRMLWQLVFVGSIFWNKRYWELHGVVQKVKLCTYGHCMKYQLEECGILVIEKCWPTFQFIDDGIQSVYECCYWIKKFRVNIRLVGRQRKWIEYTIFVIKRTWAIVVEVKSFQTPQLRLCV